MYIALIDKELFANLLRFGEVILPDYSFSAISDELPVEEALRLILREGNPIEYPSQYIIVEYGCSENPNILHIFAIRQLTATDADGMRLFSSQFRDDLIIQPEKYKNVFEEYLDDDFRKDKIRKGIVSFRTLCGLDARDNYDDEVNIIYRGITNRIKYRHHFQLPAEERVEPYALMISYDRHAPYPKGWTGYFFDVIESFCYHKSPNMGYSEAVIEGTGIYKRISSLPADATSRQIVEEIQDEKFTQLCNEFYNRPGGYLTPYLFFILRDRFRDSDSFAKHSNLISQMMKLFPEAFDTASIFIGGFFGYEKFYDDYYTALNLPILRTQQPFRPTKPDEAVPGKDKKSYREVTSEIESPVAATEVDATQTTVEEKPDINNPVPEVEAAATSADEPAPAPEKEPRNHDALDANPLSHEPEDMFLDGTDLFKNMYYAISGCLNKGVERDRILAGLSLHKDEDAVLEEIRGLFMSSLKKKDLIKRYLRLSKYPSKSITKVRKCFQQFNNK